MPTLTPGSLNSMQTIIHDYTNPAKSYDKPRRLESLPPNINLLITRARKIVDKTTATFQSSEEFQKGEFKYPLLPPSDLPVLDPSIHAFLAKETNNLLLERHIIFRLPINHSFLL
ncbi:hypothetical protein EYC84_009048 [Monilinia fructicola]|uniref:Uncharacterized protein n=1 Tax=Monilinia fructicola TaxID=38448 RepID=A0A5M9JFK0_MONFR|nr:hypothetical protein EYC84_009048 [Monilinia fructicola]